MPVGPIEIGNDPTQNGHSDFVLSTPISLRDSANGIAWRQAGFNIAPAFGVQSRSSSCAFGRRRVEISGAGMNNVVAASAERISAPQPKAGILDIGVYKPGKGATEGVTDPIKLSSNESMLGSSEAARAAFVRTASSLEIYPDGPATALRDAVAAKYGLEEDRLIFGAGSDDLFALLNQVMLTPGDNIVQGQYCYIAYAIGAQANQAEVRYAPEKDYTVDVDALASMVDDRTKIVFLANPGNPTGTYVTGSDVRRLHAAIPDDVVLLLDGAYAEFVDDPAYEDGIELARESQNVIVTRTFSKLHGLAGLRVGWGYGSRGLIDAMNRVRLPFNVNAPAQAAAAAALGDTAFQQASLDLISKWRPWLTDQLRGIGLEVVPSKTNFLLVGFPDSKGKSAAEAEA